jgi:lysophospholipase L1-like esterase
MLKIDFVCTIYFSVLTSVNKYFYNMENGRKYILAFGDSLTKGFYSMGMKYHPYSIKMNSLLEEDKFNYTVIDSGINGEQTESMVERIQQEIQSSGVKFHTVILYAGVNDLGFRSAESILENILTIHTYVTEQRIKFIILSLPENKCDTKFKFIKEKRRALNHSIRSVSKEKENFYLCDLDTEIQYSKMTKEEKSKYWDDQVHYSPEGYDLLGEIIFNKIKSLI